MRFFLPCILLLMTFFVHASPALHTYTLDNGLTILVKEDHRAPVATVMLWYNIGSADEPGGITGVSHALEHMMFKGTQKYPAGEFSKIIAGIGGQENAVTNADYTAYFETIPATELPVALQLEADRMHNLLFDPGAFQKEIQVVREERALRTDNNPQALLFERYMATAHLTEPYHHPIIGWMSDLKEMRLQDLKSWYSNFYNPNNATLVVTGDVKPHNVYALAKVYFAEIPQHAIFKRKHQIEPPSLGQKQTTVEKSAQLPLLMVGYLVPSAVSHKTSSDPYVLEIIAGILDAGDNGRLTRDLIRNTRIASQVNAYYPLYSRYQTQFILLGIPAANHPIDDLKRMFQKEILRLQQELVTKEELQRVKNQIIAQKVFEKDSIFSQAMALGLLSTLGLKDETIESYTQKIKQVTPQQIQTVAKHYFIDQAITEARLAPIQQSQ